MSKFENDWSGFESFIRKKWCVLAAEVNQLAVHSTAADLLPLCCASAIQQWVQCWRSDNSVQDTTSTRYRISVASVVPSRCLGACEERAGYTPEGSPTPTPSTIT
ncbi:hypothetical protein CBL_05407 [Carabus blaptoides fortunei]